MNVVILKYNAGNVFSVYTALQRLGIEAQVTDSPDVLQAADRVIIPGVGEAQTAMQYLRHRGLDLLIKDLTQPVLGVCLGLQLFCSYSEENNTECLGIFPQKVRRFSVATKVPHMGWNTIQDLKTPLFAQIESESYVYYVHSYYAEVGETTIATGFYEEPFSAALNVRNFSAVQFHPEKSASVGKQILENFLAL